MQYEHVHAICSFARVVTATALHTARQANAKCELTTRLDEHNVDQNSKTLTA